jgi:DNA-binding response OmpR family regulator
LQERLIWNELARTPGYVVPHEQLQRHCAGDSRVHICRLRRKTGATIRSSFGEGYVLVLDP